MNWTDYPDAVYCISLPKSHDRRKTFLKEMAEYDIPVSIWPGIHHVNGAIGLKQTYKEIFENSVRNDYGCVWIMEDDNYFVSDPNKIMNEVIDQLPKNWGLLYMGINAFGGFQYQYSKNLLSVHSEGYSTHSVMYSKMAMQVILERMDKYPQDAIDVILGKHIQKLERTFATFPMLCSQRSGFSLIENREVDYKKYIDDRYNAKVKLIDAK